MSTLIDTANDRIADLRSQRDAAIAALPGLRTDEANLAGAVQVARQDLLDAELVVQRLRDRLGGLELPLKAVRHQFASAVDLIIQVNRLQGGPRKVTHVTEVLNMEQETVIMQDIFLYIQDGIDENGKAFGHFESTGVRPSCMSRLEAAGVRLPANLFAARILGH